MYWSYNDDVCFFLFFCLKTIFLVEKLHGSSTSKKVSDSKLDLVGTFGR